MLLVLSTVLASTETSAQEPTWWSEVQALRVHRMGVDRAGHLWSWHKGTQQVRLFDADGSTRAQAQLAESANIDADHRWGIAAVSEQGDRLLVFDWQGKKTLDLTSPNLLGDVAWIAETMLAVTTKAAGHQVELWDLGKAVPTATLGREEEIRPMVGAHRLRFARVHYDAQSEQLITFDTFTGALQVFTLAGERLWHAEIENPRAEYYGTWLRQMDEQARAEGEVRTPSFVFWDSFQVDEQGAVWLLEQCDYESQTGTFLRLSADGEREARKAKLAPCCAPEFVFWQDKLIVYREPNTPRPACTGLGDLP